MNQKIEFESSKPVDVLKEETLNYFQRQGFKLTVNDENSLQFERGSVMRNMVTFNPLKWKNSIKIKFEEDRVKASFDINTIHQAVALKEERLWWEFVSNYQQTIVSIRATHLAHPELSPELCPKQSKDHAPSPRRDPAIPY